MASPTDGARPERADTVDEPAELTVFGVDPADGDVPAALRDVVPADADALVLDRPAAPPSPTERATSYLHNPALLFRGVVVALYAVRDRSLYGTTDRRHDRRAVEDLARDRGVPVVEAGRHPVAAASAGSLRWRAGGWIAFLAALAAVLAVALSPGVGTGVFLVAALALVAAYLLAYSGATIDSAVERLFERVRDAVDERGARHPVVVVRSSRRPGVVRRAKEERIRTRERQLSPASDGDADSPA